MKVGFVSLGCSKNLVDTEMMCGLFKKNNFEIVSEKEMADVIVINTCGFIESAKEEAVNTILEMAELKKKNCKFLIVTGCLVERYKDELEKELPEVDLFIKFSEYENFWSEIVKKIKAKTSARNELDFLEREISTGENYAYIRIADGCDNYCTFCAIPYIRGRFKSRKMEDILKEAKRLTSLGIREIILIAQDTTKYGIDIYNVPKLAELLHKLSEIEGIEWIRFLYSYPETITDELIKEVKTNKKVCKYFDIPIQHIANRLLKKMNRKNTKESTKILLEKLRKEIPDVVIRSTVIVGFPGEDESDFKELLDFIKWAKFEKLGAFMYSKEEGTPASKMLNQVPLKIKKQRLDLIMKEQQEISRKNLKKYIGKEYKTLIEDAYVNSKNEVVFVGRTYMDAPEIDGFTFIKADPNKLQLNTFINCKITKVQEYDLIAEI